jgi:hypothetical protein
VRSELRRRVHKQSDNIPPGVRRRQLNLTHALETAATPNSPRPFRLKQLDVTPPPPIKPRGLHETAPRTLHLPTTDLQLLQYPRELTNKTTYRQLYNEIWENRSPTVRISTDGCRSETGNCCAIIYLKIRLRTMDTITPRNTSKLTS